MENIDFNNLATRKDLKSEIGKVRQEMATKQDLKSEIGKVRQEMATKQDLSRFFGKLDAKIDKINDKLENKIQEKFDQVLTSNDKQIKILKEMRLELAAHNASYKRHDEKIDDIEKDIEDHEQRIAVLELKPAI